jgi:hypothetical protein
VGGVLLATAGAHPGVGDGELRPVADRAKPFERAVHAKGPLERDLHFFGGNRKAGLRQGSTKERHAAGAGLASQAGLIPQGSLLFSQGRRRVRGATIEKLLVSPVVDRRHDDPLPAKTATFAVGQQGSEAFRLSTCRRAGRVWRVHRGRISRLGSKEANPRRRYGCRQHSGGNHFHREKVRQTVEDVPEEWHCWEARPQHVLLRWRQTRQHSWQGAGHGSSKSRRAGSGRRQHAQSTEASRLTGLSKLGLREGQAADVWVFVEIGKRRHLNAAI